MAKAVSRPLFFLVYKFSRILEKYSLILLPVTTNNEIQYPCTWAGTMRGYLCFHF